MASDSRGRTAPASFTRRAMLRAAAMLSWIFAAGSALALDPGYSLTQYQHTVWTDRDGAPTNIVGIALGEDGYLWLAGTLGLSRFDGFEFETVKALGGESLGTDRVVSLSNGPRRSLFLNFGAGRGAAEYAGGRLIRFPDCMSAGSAIEVEGGTTWLLCNGRPVALEGDRVVPLGKDWHLPEGTATEMTRDKEGTVWITLEGQVLSRRVGERSFRPSGARAGAAPVAGPDGRLWSTGPAGLTSTRFENGLASDTRTTLPGSFSRMHFDRDGGLWAVNPSGLVHVGDIGRLTRAVGNAPFGSDVMTRTSGLASDAITALFEDDRGDIWIGTTAGLERFKDNYLFPIKLPGQALAASIAPGDNGSIWTANYTGALLQVSKSAIKSFDEVGRGVTCLARAPDGSVWVAAGEGRIYRIRGEAISLALTVPADIRGSAITAMTWDTAGILWIGTTINGLIASYAGGQWTTPQGIPDMPPRWTSRTILADSRGRLWASRRYELRRLEKQKATLFYEAQGLKVGEVLTLSERGPRVWAGGTQGVAYLDGAAFQTLKPATEGAFSEITGILETETGDLWIHQYASVLKVPAAELEKQRKTPDYRVHFERFDALDGLYGTSPALSARPSMAEATDGRMWFSTSEGLAVVDPAHARPAAYVPKLVIQGISVDGVSQNALKPLSLGREPKSVRFRYTAVSPGGAEGLQFRYRLEGVDTEWTEAGNRRAISYNSLVPGSYRFRVESADGGGGWAANDAFFDFDVEPRWYETTPFRVVAAALALLVAWALYDRQIKRTSRRVRFQMRVQQTERERLARDLHDTLLQGIHGLIWRLQGIADEIAPGDPVRGKLESALDNTDGLLAESRRRVVVLRTETRAQPSLAVAVEDAVLSTVALHPCPYSVVAAGESRQVLDTVQANVCDIVREAFTNSVKHGQASSVRIEIEYSAQALVVRIIDDGKGFAPELARRGRSGHWGISGMKERAAELGGALLIRTAVGTGTEVSYRLAARKAFETRRKSVGPLQAWLLLFRSLRR